ncbi:MAG: hypothetical protein AB7F86_06465 [Bdellovibrionales bacterium]
MQTNCRSQFQQLKPERTNFIPKVCGCRTRAIAFTTKQRYTQLNLLGFGRQPIARGQFDIFARADLLSATWAEGDGFWYSPGAEIGVLVPIGKLNSLAVSTRVSLGPGGEDDSPTYSLMSINLGWIRADIFSPESVKPKK